MGDRPPAITRESWSPPPPHEGPDLTHDWLEGHAETVGTFSWVVPLQPLPRLPPCPFGRPFLCLSPSSFLPFSAEGPSCVLSGNQDVETFRTQSCADRKHRFPKWIRGVLVPGHSCHHLGPRVHGFCICGVNIICEDKTSNKHHSVKTYFLPLRMIGAPLINSHL